MKYYWLITADQRPINWLLFLADPTRRPRERYRSLCCPSCGKVDEEKALHLGFDDDVRVSSRLDVFETDDGYLCVSVKARNVIEENGILGLEYYELPGAKFFIVWPTHRISAMPTIVEQRQVEVMDFDRIAGHPELIDTAKKMIQVDFAAGGMEFHNRCHTCGRYEYTRFWPTLKDMVPPKEPLLVIATDVPSEDSISQNTQLLASEVVVDIFRKSHLRGLDPYCLGEGG
jgi:hypothetical protein